MSLVCWGEPTEQRRSAWGGLAYEARCGVWAKLHRPEGQSRLLLVGPAVFTPEGPHRTMPFPQGSVYHLAEGSSLKRVLRPQDYPRQDLLLSQLGLQPCFLRSSRQHGGSHRGQ